MSTSADLEFERSESQLDEGLFLKDLNIGDVIALNTKHRSYAFENRGNGQILISGHPKYCPQPVLVELNGSTWGGPMMKVGFIGRGMLLEFRHPIHGIIRTSPIQEIRRLEDKSRTCVPHLVSKN